MKIRNLPLTCCLLICLACSSLLHGQQVLKGIITDSLKKAIPNAAIFLLSENDSTLLHAMPADNLGHFEIKFTEQVPFIIRITAIGYKEGFLRIEQQMPSLSVMNIVLHEDYGTLAEIHISDKKNLFERKPDRIVFNVSSSISSLGSNALDMLKKSPGVMVRQSDNTISLIGKSMVQVMVNDRLLQLTPEDLMAYLEAIPAENIDRIEIITAPPAKYDASGNSGLINIVLKKNDKLGFRGNVRTAFEQASNGKGIAGGELNYVSDKIILFGNVNHTLGANQITERLNTPYPGQIFDVTDSYRKILKPLQFSLGADYTINKSNSFGIQWISNNANRVDDAKDGIRVLQLPFLTLDSTMLTRGHTTLLNHNNILNVNYTAKVDSSGKKISFNANRLWFNSNRTNNFETTNYLNDYTTPNGIFSKNRSIGKQEIDIATLQTDLELPFKWIHTSFGGKLSFIRNESNNEFGYFDSDGYHLDPSISNGFNYHEKVQALYASAQKEIEKWSFQGGLRAELTQTEGYSVSLNQTNKNHYFNLFPSAFIQYQINADHVLNINYSKRINRPDYRSLDPFRAYSTPYHYNQGNPFLQPSFNHNVEVNYTYKGKFTITGFYQLEQQHFASVWVVDPVLNITSGQSLNFADYRSYGMNAMGTFEPVKMWNLQLQLSLQQQELRSSIYSASSQSYQSIMYYLGMNNSFTLNASKTLLAEINMYYLSRYREDFLEINPVGNVDIGIKALLYKQRVVIGINAGDVLATQKFRGTHIITGQTINNYFDTRNIRFSIQYKLGNHKIKERQQQNNGIEDESQRVR